MIKIKIEQGELRKSLTLRQFFAAQEGDMKIVIDVIAGFITDEDGNRLPKEQGKELLLDLTLDELENIFKTVMGSITDGAVPPASATSSSLQ